jgi:hypothetical protein
VVDSFPRVGREVNQRYSPERAGKEERERMEEGDRERGFSKISSFHHLLLLF